VRIGHLNASWMTRPMRIASWNGRRTARTMQGLDGRVPLSGTGVQKVPV
jgi:hypothetical protein